jgi:VacB/RNase II family 3'-5' exoribonuclease
MSGLNISERLASIRQEQELPERFSSEVLNAAEAAVAAFETAGMAGRVDLRHLDFETLDPESSTDLDQAFAVSSDGNNVILHYALADIAAFAPSGGVIEAEALTRGVTVYAPDQRVPLYPPLLSQDLASLLPAGPRPAVVMEVSISPSGEPTLLNAVRAVIHSRRKRAYETTEPSDLDPLVVELFRRISLAEVERGATKINWAEQEVVRDDGVPGGYSLVLRPMRPSEEVNAAMSLAVNIAIAKVMLENKTGLFRIMPGPDSKQQRGLRRVARALGISWKRDQDLREILPQLDPGDERHKKFLLEARRAGRGASYALFDPASPPFHSALASVYAHATAPMRRLADRYVIELVLLLLNEQPIKELEDSLFQMPGIMAAADRRARFVETAVIDLLEAVAMVGRVGETFDATILEKSSGGVVVQLTDPPVRARASQPKTSSAPPISGEPSESQKSAERTDDPPGEDTSDDGKDELVRVRLTDVDVDRRQVKFVIVNE